MSLLVYGLRFACGMVLTQEEILKCLTPEGECSLDIRRSTERLSNLKIDGMRIRTIEEIRMPFVCELMLSNNELTELPSLEFMPMLKTLDVRQNPIENLVVKHPSLKYLYASGCVMQSATFDTPELLSADLSQNILRDIKGNLSSLASLDISYNVFESFDVFQFPKLKCIKASRNLIQEIEVLRPHSLKTFDLRHNLVTKIGDLDLPWLVNLHLSGNRLESIPKFTHLHSLRAITLTDNPLRILPEFKRPFLEFIALKGTQVKFLAPDLLGIVDEPIAEREHNSEVLNIIKSLPYPIYEVVAEEIMV